MGLVPRGEDDGILVKSIMSGTIAQRLFDATHAKAEIEESLTIEYEELGWDPYDESLEIYGVAPDIRLDGPQLQAIHEAGFHKVYVNHIDKWETHYTFAADGSTRPWRVSYPHKRGDGGTIWVEEFPPGWPADWLETGYVTEKAAT